jgi:hypothetical protein
MKRFIIVAFACALAPLAGAQLYKYLDKDGRTVYSDQPPANIESKQMNVPSAPPSSSPSSSKSALERDKDLEKGRAKTREDAKKSDEAARNAQLEVERCNQARSTYQTYVDGGRLFKYNEKQERVALGDEEMATEREKARREVDEACKKG